MARKLPERRAEPRRWTGWISAATALALTGGLWLAGVLPQAQQILYDAAVSHASPGAMSEAVLVDLDARSLAAAGGNWTYDNHAALIDRLARPAPAPWCMPCHWRRLPRRLMHKRW